MPHGIVKLVDVEIDSLHCKHQFFVVRIQVKGFDKKYSGKLAT